MILYPAMDLMGGRPVRLAQGRFDDRTDYAADPAAALAGFAEAGARWAHIVDLDGARAREPRQHDVIADLARRSGLSLQVAGGVRSADHVQRLLDAGAARVAIGSLAVTAPALVAGFIDRFGAERITLAIDVRLIDGVPRATTSGWTEDSALSLWDIAALYPKARHILITDIARDGMLSGPNVALMEEAAARLDLAVQASGGVAETADLRRLREAGAAGAIVGKALWEGRIDLAEAIDAGV